MRAFHIKVSKINFESKKNDGYTVFSGSIYKNTKKNPELKITRETVTVSGYFRSIYPGDMIYVEAEKYEHKIYGEQYRVLTYKRDYPGTIKEIQNFLIHRGAGLGIARAIRITKAYGLKTLDVIINDPTALDPFDLSDETKNKIREDLIENQEFEHLLMFLQMHKIDPIYANMLYHEYGTMSVVKLKSDPYSPFRCHIWSFHISDALNASLGYASDTPERLRAVIYASILWDSESGGNLYMPIERVQELTEKFLNYIHTPYQKKIQFTKEQYMQTISELELFGQITIDNSIHKNSIYLVNNWANERKIAEQLVRLVESPKRIAFAKADITRAISDYESISGIKLASRQKQAVETALVSHVSVITGGPGTGKTKTIQTIINCLRTLEPGASIRVCAPTGKAAIRAEEMSGLPASTIHRMLRLFRRGSELGPEELECDFLIADEYSMVDAYLCNKLFTAASSFTRIIMVGDADQLPSVGPGLVLRDFIKSGKIPVVELNQIFRQAKQSRIIQNAMSIIRVQDDKLSHLKLCKKPGGDFYFLNAETISDIRLTIQKAVHQLKNKYGYGINDIQILTPVRKTALGSESLNVLFQEEFLPKSTTPCIEFDEKEFRLGDKVIHTKNNSEFEVYNGEVGFITHLSYQSDDMLTVEYPHNKVIHYSLEMLDELDLAYSMTVHKSQGSEFPAVIIPIHESILYGMNKHIIYTALTRAKNIVILVGVPDVFGACIRNDDTIGDRRSHLIDLINSYI